MVELFDRIVPWLGLAAFVCFATLLWLTIKQSRELRRLRAWAGQAPEVAERAVGMIRARRPRTEPLPSSPDRSRP